IRLHPVLRCQPTSSNSSQVRLVLGQADGKLFAIVVDQLVQEYYQQTDQIQEDFSRFPLISAAIALENDYIAFILNIQELLSKSI
ncbi:MAG: chemotaxis protein CheW, partial [Planctomycetota bacterium]